MEIEELEKIGLTRGESKVYTTLILAGSTTAGKLIRKTGMQRSAVYFCLDSLVNKGLVSYYMKNDRKQFEANKPESLFKFLGEKKGELERSERNLKTLVKGLLARKDMEKEKEDVIKIYEGWGGVLNAFFDVLGPLSSKDEGCAFLPTSNYGGADAARVRKLIRRVRTERAKKKIKFRIVMCEDLKGTLGRDQEKTPHTKVRYLPKESSIPAVVNVYADTTVITLWTEPPMAFLIKNENVADSFRKYFEIIWKQAKE